MFLFFAVVILVGILMLVLSFFMILLDRKKGLEISDKLMANEESLIEVIQDAEQIVDEMNNFSDYLLDRIETKAKEMEHLLDSVTQKLNENENKKGDEYVVYKSETQSPKIHEDKVVEKSYKMAVNGGFGASTFVVPVQKDANFLAQAVAASKQKQEHIALSEPIHIPSEKIIPINPKHRNVYSLYEKGYGEIEIAKMLNMGLGEIRLILGVKR